MSKINWLKIRVGEVILGDRFDPLRENHIRCGVRVIAVGDGGLKVKRINAVHLREPVEEWVIPLWHLEKYNMKLLPLNAQLPLL